MNSQVAKTAKTALESELKRRSLPLNLLSMLIPQLSGETAGFEDAKAVKYNNYSGMTYQGQAAAYNTGIPKPKGEAKGTYAGYNTPQLWAKDYLDTMQRNFPAALQATNFAQFAAALKNGKGGRQYYEAPESDYLKMLKSWVPQMSRLFPDVNFKQAANVAVIIIIAAIAAYLLIN